MIFGRDVRVREVELATRLAAHANVFALDHTESLNKTPHGIGDKLRMRLDMLRTPFEVTAEGPGTPDRLPIVAGPGVLN